MSNNNYSWEFDDKKNRWKLWYIIALSIVIWLSIWWFFTKQYWMSFIILLISGLVYFVDNNSENNIKVEINDIWIKISQTFYNFGQINSFWIVYKWEEAILLRLFLNKKWLQTLDIKIDNNMLDDIKNILWEHIEQTNKLELSLSEKFINLLKL